jgi:four helix bundle protein
MSANLRSFRDGRVLQAAFNADMEIVSLSEHPPAGEEYPPADRIRRSARAVGTNIGEAWRNRRCKAAFIAQTSAADGEACEAQIGPRFRPQCRYFAGMTAERLFDVYEKILVQLTKMICGAAQWTIRPPVKAPVAARLPVAASPHPNIPVPVSPRRRVAASPRQEA